MSTPVTTSSCDQCGFSGEHALFLRTDENNNYIRTNYKDVDRLNIEIYGRLKATQMADYALRMTCPNCDYILFGDNPDFSGWTDPNSRMLVEKFRGKINPAFFALKRERELLLKRRKKNAYTLDLIVVSFVVIGVLLMALRALLK